MPGALALPSLSLRRSRLVSAAASPAVAQVHVGVDPTVVVEHPRDGEGLGVARGTGQFRGRYQLRLGEARRILGP